MSNMLWALGRGFISFLDRFGLGHVLPLLRRPVETRAFPVVHVRLCIDPNEAVAAARRGDLTRSLCAGAACRHRRDRGTGRSRSFRFEQIAQVELPGEGAGVGCAAAVACAFFAARCFAGVGDGEGDLAGDGDCPCATQTPANPTRAMRAKIFVVVAASLTKSQDRRQSLSISVCFPRLAPLRRKRMNVLASAMRL